MKNGFLITFEGPNGVGKTLQTELLKKRLENLGVPTVIVREPGSVLLAEQIREYLMSLPVGFLRPEIECELYYMGRSQLLKEIVIPNLEANKVVISDRFEDSTIVYQGILGKVSPDFLTKLNQKYMSNIKPDVTFLLDAEFSKVKPRLEKQLSLIYDPADELDQCSYNKIRNAYKILMGENKFGRWKLIDSNEAVQTVERKIFACIEPSLRSRFNPEGNLRKIEK